MSKTRVNYKSDLPPIEVTFKVNTVAADVPENDFVLRFFVDGCSESYFCGCRYEDGEPEYTRCAPTSDGKKLICYISNHKFTPGRLRVEYIDLVQNSHYEDGVKKTVVPDVLDVVLVDGAGDEVDNVVTDNFHLTVGRGILDVVKTDTVGIVDTYTIYFDDGKTETYTITNGRDGVDLGEVAVADDLVTNDSTKVLSAKQGYVLGNIVAPMEEKGVYTSLSLLSGYWAITNSMISRQAPVETSRHANPSDPTSLTYHLYESMYLAVKAGDVVRVETMGRYSARPWAVTDTDRMVLSASDETSNAVDVTLEIEQDGYVFVNCIADDGSVTHNHNNYLLNFKVTHTINYAGNVKQVPKLRNQAQSQYGVKEYDADSLVLNYVWQNAAAVENVSIYRVNNSYHGSLFFPVYSGDTVTLNTRAYTNGSTTHDGGITNGVAWCVTDADRNIVSVAEATDEAVVKTLHIEQDGFVFLNCAKDYEDENEEKLFSVTHIYNKVRKEAERSTELANHADNPTDNMMLLYYGDNTRRHWSPSDLEHVLVHTHSTAEKKGVTEWFFSSLLYLEFRTNDSHSFGWGLTGDNSTPATRTDFDWIIDRYFSEAVVNGEHEGLRALEGKIEDLKKTMGTPPRRHKVVLTMPIPYYYLHGSDDTSANNHWGKLRKTDIPSYDGGWSEGDPWADIFGEYDTLLFDVSPSAGDGNYSERTLNTKWVDGVVVNDRPIVMKWFIDTVIERFNAKGYQNIELAGFDWVTESLTYPQYAIAPNGTDPTIGEMSEYIRGKGFKLYWIPFRVAVGRYSRAGIDETYLQTGYLFNKEASMTKQVMEEAYKEAVMHGMGVEFELDNTIFVRTGDPTEINEAKMARLEELLDVFEKEKYFSRVNIAYYFTGQMQIWMSQSPVERVRKFMDRLCTLINNVESSATSLTPVIETKQDTLISGTNIKTINNQSLLGSGNISIQDGGGGGSQIQSDWSQSDSTQVDYIKNKPSLADVATSGSYDDLEDKPTIPDAQIQADWNQATTTAKDYIKNKPTIPDISGKADKTFKVTITSTTESDVTTYSSDKTVAQILEAYQAGRQVIAVNNNEEYGIFTLTSVTNIGALFEGTLASANQMVSFEITGSGVTFTVSELQSELTFDASPTANSNNPVKSGGVYTALSNKLDTNFCPIIEDTRSQATDVNITGTAPFATLAGGQRIVLHSKYANTASPTLQLTLSGGTTTLAYPLYQNYNNGINALTPHAMPAGSYGEFVFDSTNSRWVLIGKDFNTTYSNTSQADINNSAQGSRLIEPKLLRDNFYLKSEVNNMCPVIEDTRNSNASNITGVAPFSTLVDKQKVIIHLAYTTGNYTTLQLTLNDGVTTTNAIPIYARTEETWVGQIADGHFRAGTYMELIYNSSENRWYCLNLDRDTITWRMSQTEINNAINSDPRSVPTGKLIHDNAYIVEESYTSGSLKANKFYDFGTVSSALTIPSLDATNDLVSNVLNFYALRFIAGADNLNITFPTGVIVDDTPTINTGDYVEIMINLYVENNTNHFYASIKVWQAQ